MNRTTTVATMATDAAIGAPAARSADTTEGVLTMAVQVASRAPGFTLPDQSRQEVSLASLHSEKNLLLVFFPFAFSSICQDELCRVRDDIGQYQNDLVQVAGISTDTPFSLNAWAAQQKYTFPLLSDFWPHGAVAQAYGVFNEAAGMANRATFLIDIEGGVRFSEMVSPRERRDQDIWKRAINELVR